MNILARPSFLCLLVLSIVFASAAHAQVDSTVLLTSTPAEARLDIRNSTQRTDTVLDNLHNYYETGVLGNIGLPSYSLLIDYVRAPEGMFRWMQLNNSRDLFTSAHPVYFFPQGKVYTKVFAAMGQKQEQVFKLLHSQNIKRVNLSLAFNRYSCIGFYARQRSVTDNFLLSSHASTKNGRLGYRFYVLYNKLKYELNGGIDTSRVDFEENMLVEKQLFPVMLSSAKQNVRTAEVSLESFVRLNKDSGAVQHLLSHEVNYQSSYWLYTDHIADSARFDNTYFYYASTGGSHDSVSYKLLANDVFYKLATAKTVLYAGYRNELSQYYQTFIDTAAMNHLLVAGARLAAQGHLATARLQYAVAGANAGNYSAELAYRLSLNRFFVQARARAEKQMTHLMSQRFFGSHFIWSAALSDQLSQTAKVEAGSDKYRFTLGVVVQSQENLVYFDTLALPKQHTGSILSVRAYLQKDLKLGPIHFNNVLNYQVISDPSVMRLPAYHTAHQLYYEAKLFKKALWLQAGVQARYVSAFKANAYMPATHQFYLQNEREYGNYVWVDVFINAQIERFRFFLLGSHINMGLSGPNFMLAPNYPMPDRSIKAGLCWMFFD